MSIFSTDQLSPILPQALRYIIAEREQYADVYQAIELYAVQAHMIFGGTSGVNMLLQKPKSLDDYYYELYSEQSFTDANALCNAIAEKLQLPKVVSLRTVIPYSKYNILVDGRVLVTVYHIGTGITKVISPESLSEKLLLPPEIQLINTYRTLYSPNKADEWETALHDENALFDRMIETRSDFADDQQKKTGSGDLKKYRDRLQHSLLKNFVTNNKSCVLLGEHALFLNDPKAYHLESAIIQIISSKPIQEDIAAIRKLSEYPVTHSDKELRILQDFRLCRTTVRIGDASSGEQKEVMYIYNAAHYDLIPYSKHVMSDQPGGFIQTGNPFVLLRFLLIDFWIIRLIHSAGRMDDNYKNLRLQSIRNKVLMLRTQLSSGDLTTINELHTSDQSKLRIFQTKEYIGQYENEDIASKMVSIQAKKYPEYYPQEYHRKNNEYRILDPK